MPTIEIENYRGFTSPTRASFDLGSGITSFVGRNNSGKSSLLKFFYEFRNMFTTLAGNLGAFFLDNPPFLFQYPQDAGDPLSLFPRENSDPIRIRLELNETPLHVSKVVDNVRTMPANNLTIEIRRDQPRWAYAHTNYGDKKLRGNVGGSTDALWFTMDSGLRLDFTDIVSLLQKLGSTLYIGPFRNVLNIGERQQYYDMNVGQAFIREWANAQSGALTGRETIQNVIKDIEEIFDIGRLTIDANIERNQMITTINYQPFDITELGSGLVQFIATLYYAKTRNPQYVLIDEPESNLHPSLQLDFLTRLAESSKTGLMFATHSLGLARAAADRIYSVHKESLKQPSRLYTFDGLRNMAELLGELSYAGNYDLGFRKILLVEGPSEIKTFQQFLRKLHADHAITIIDLGGDSGIANADVVINQILSITNNVFALVDSERKNPDAVPKARRAFKNVCDRAGIECHLTDRHSTESYFPDHVVKAVYGGARAALDPYDSVPDWWRKHDNWRLANQMTIDEVKNCDLGDFLVRVVAAPNEKRVKKRARRPSEQSRH